MAEYISKTDVKATISYAGRVERVRPQPIPKRIGGFGGIAGLAAYLKSEKITHVVDATHPFASQMSHNAIAACQQLAIPLVALTRPAWQSTAHDNWHEVPDIAAAAEALPQENKRIMLAIGRMHLKQFYHRAEHFYLLRLVDAPAIAPAFVDHVIEVSRGPFTTENDIALMQQHNIDLVVAKNAGGKGAYAKIAAARDLGLKVIMIRRPQIAGRTEVSSCEAVFHWLSENG